MNLTSVLCQSFCYFYSSIAIIIIIINRAFTVRVYKLITQLVLLSEHIFGKDYV